jgi:hypothetical protein
MEVGHAVAARAVAGRAVAVQPVVARPAGGAGRGRAAERRAPIVLCAAALALSLVSLLYSVRPGREARPIACAQFDLGSQPD